jgi:ATP-dependent DNA helicase RecG
MIQGVSIQMSKSMDPESKLDELLASHESEIVEFKKAENNFHFNDIGKYFSALCNEANLKNHESAWLVFGVDDHRNVVGSNFRPIRTSIESLKREVAEKMTSRLTFVEVYEVERQSKRVILFQIPPAPRGIPIAYEGHYYGRDGESLGPLNIEEVERIRAQSNLEDWSSVVVPQAGLEDLDTDAILQARLNFMAKFPDKTQEAEGWDDMKFLNKAKLTIKGQVTRTALLLIGKEESEHYLSPADPKIRWILKGSDGNDRDYAIFGMPLLLAVDKVFGKIRNLKYRYMRDGTLFPEEIDQYESLSIREAINNCIAHQDYTCAGRINVIERDESLTFTNLGSFVPGDVRRVVIEDTPEEYYRNRFLATAMFNLKMVDTAGGGIRKMFMAQRKRFFPLPDYNLSDNRVEVTLIGKVLDLNYARLLASDGSLTLEEIMLLDCVQKQQPLTSDQIATLRSKQLIEGRKPNFFIAKSVAQKTGQKVQYSKNKGLTNEQVESFILKALTEHGEMERAEIDRMVWDILPAWMDEKKKRTRVENLLRVLRESGKIANHRNGPKSIWHMAPSSSE